MCDKIKLLPEYWAILVDKDDDDDAMFVVEWLNENYLYPQGQGMMHYIGGIESGGFYGVIPEIRHGGINSGHFSSPSISHFLWNKSHHTRQLLAIANVRIFSAGEVKSAIEKMMNKPGKPGFEEFIQKIENPEGRAPK